ncbi:MAG: cobalt ECF transporter T component CbiQ [Desulfosarcina sp.]|nr:cobalt ECF transporter T component CbiQ [Desulfobacterales bacterium]
MIEELSLSDSFLEEIDPRVKLIILFLFSIVMAASYRFETLITALFICILIIVAGKVPLKEIFKRLIPVNTLIILLWLILPFSIKGDPVFSIGPFIATKAGLIYTAQISIKSNAMMLMLIAVISSTRIFTIGHALHKLGIPTKLVQLFLFTFRYIHVIYKEYLRLVNAMKIRGFEPGTNLHTYKTFAYLVGMLLVKSSDRAKRVHNAMLCRGFNGRFYSLTSFSMNRKDLFILLLMIFFIVVLGLIEWVKISW